MGQSSSYVMEVWAVDFQIQFNSLFHFTQSNTMYTAFQIIYVLNKLYIQ